MTGVELNDIISLRNRTGAGLVDCKNALLASDSDVDKAVERLRVKGQALMEKKTVRKASHGLIYSYIHPGNQIGVLVEIACETDFMAKSEVFKNFAHEVALQVAAMDPYYIDADAIPPSMLRREYGIFEAQAIEEGKSEKIIPKIVSGRVDKWTKEVCLLTQPYIKDKRMTIRHLLQTLNLTSRENCYIRRFTRWEVGKD